MEPNQYNRNQNPGERGEGRVPRNAMILIIAAVLSFLLMSTGRDLLRDQSQKEVSYNEFYDMVEAGVVESVTVGDTEISIRVKDDAEGYTSLLHYYTIKMEDPLRTQMLIKYGVESFQEKPDTTGFIWDILLGLVLPFVGVFLIMNLMMRRMGGGSGGIMGVGKSTAKMYMQKETGVSFQDVAGEDEAKESLVEIVDFLHNPEKYRTIGAKLPKGALLVGPPGTGKTLLAKAVAGEAEVPFFSLTGSDFVEMFAGVGASRVRDLFKQANAMAPCIVFIDEIDAIGKSRENRFGGSGNDEREQTLNQLLSEMDGFDPGKGIMVLGATNRPEILDPALLRPGRFDRRIVVEKPDLKGRINILKVHSKDVKLDETVDFEEIGLATSGAVGADLANMMNEAAIMAVKHGRAAVSQKDLFEAVEVVLVGKEKKDRILSKEERRIVSYHEVGHALIAAVQKHAEPVQKITIVPRTMGALGYVMQVPEEEKYLNTKKELEAMIVTALGGRAAEELVFDSVTTGASNDIEKATAVAKAMITQYGMSERFGLIGLARTQDMYLSGRTVLDCGDATATEIDHEVKKLLDGAYAEAKRILSEHRKALSEIADYLIEKETITGKEFMEIFRKAEGEEPGQEAENASAALQGEQDKEVLEKSSFAVENSPSNALLNVPSNALSDVKTAQRGGENSQNGETVMQEAKAYRKTSPEKPEEKKASFEEVFRAYVPQQAAKSGESNSENKEETEGTAPSKDTEA